DGLLLSRNRVRIGQPVLRGLRLAEQLLQLLVREADQIEIERVLLQRFEFDAKHLLVPPRAHGQAVVRENERAPLRFREVIQYNDRYLVHAQASSSRQARVPGDHYAVGPDKDRV